ncbi:MAG TPA: hypothetical protein VLH41_10280 [Thermoanaerobaculia bacterium]|nr:hypothetical protein [Thermoanaerobaculia bacterium]
MPRLRPVALLLLAASALGARPATKKPAGKVPTSPAVAPAKPSLSIPAAELKAFKARPIGPALMGGRVSDIALDPENPFAFYVGLATGGVLKTLNNGVTFDAVFEKEAVASIGAVAVAPSDPKVVWVGTGEANDRNSSGWGDGVHLSKDGGATWGNVGLPSSRAIGRIVVHPSDPKTAYVCALGNLWQPGGERGLFKTTDAGTTWKKVLSAAAPDDAKTGCGDVAMDPEHPETLWAVLYARQRTPWSFASGAGHTGGRDAGGIFRTTDGGATWTKLTKGLPARTQRIGLDVFRKEPKILYAVVQTDEGGETSIRDSKSKRGGIFRSEDGGESWTRTNPLNPRPFYFSQIRVDPANDKRVYVLGMNLHVSDDGGATFREDLFDKVHPDCHALVISGVSRSPRPPQEEVISGVSRSPRTPFEEKDAKAPLSPRLLLGTDGGLYQSFEAGKNWQHLDRFAAGEFYRVTLDDSVPYRIAGGLQDNLNWVGPSATRSKDGIVNADWTNLGGGDGFYCVFDPSDPDVIYAESQGGEVFRMNLRTGQPKHLKPQPGEGQPGFRFHWCAPFLGSVHEKGTMYLAGNRVFRLTAKGEEWAAISPDLSSRDPEKTLSVGSGAETYSVVYALAESPLRKGVLWAGTDDGRLWVTEDDGGKWTDLSAGLPAAAKGQWIQSIEASPSDVAAAYVVVSAYRSGNDAPLIYRTGDLGKSWAGVAGNLPASGPAKVVREHPKNPRLLFAGTEFGLFVSFDRGGSWSKFGELPTVAVDDLKIHPREGDLVVATHGRSLFVVDDVSPLAALTDDLRGKDAFLFEPRPSAGAYRLPGWSNWNGKANFRGENPPDGAILSFWIREFTGDEVKISVTNALDQPVANLKASGAPGFGRVVWDLHPTKEFVHEYGGDAKRFVPPGDYTVTLTSGKTKAKQKLKVTIAEGIETR